MRDIWYKRGTLKTFTDRECAEGVVVIAGFGFALDPDSTAAGELAVYLSGKLVGSQFSRSDASLYFLLSRAIAAQQGLGWTEYQAHACWSRSRHEQVPGTLVEYTIRTVEFYDNVSRDDALFALSGDYSPTVTHNEGRLVSQAFGLSGGDLSTFDEWYAAWIEKQGFFCDAPENSSDIRRGDELKSRRKGKTPEYAEIESALREKWLAYLGLIWDANKPVDPLTTRWPGD
jgi:hypothetical protein